MTRTTRWVVALLVLVGLGLGAYFWSRQDAPVDVPVASAPPVAEAPASAPAASAPGAIQHPVEAIAPDAAQAVTLPPLAESDRLVTDELSGLLGRNEVLSFLNVDGFVRRFVATVDNLARDHAASRLWPTHPTPDRILILERADGIYLDESNAERYTPLVRFAASVDMAKAAAMYKRLYPLFQQAYEDLGYSGRYFNDRLVQVIDHLLATPETTGPVKLTLTQVQGPIPSTRPWVRYEYADSKLEGLSAGQKILLRVGNANARLLKSRLTELRARIVASGAPR
ncbi:MAG: DUF3014 domain-containing protein [Burkholderiaceae bacterium]